MQQGLGEEVEALPVTSETPDQLPAQTAISNATTLGNNTGIAASSGLAFGPVHVIKPKVYQYERMGLSVKAEKENLDIALHAVKIIFTKLLPKLMLLKLNKSFKLI